MKAAYTEAAGGPELVKVGELPTPDPADDEILVRNHAAGVGPWDWKMLAGRWGQLSFPNIPGFEFAGVVEKAPNSSGFAAGDEVWGRSSHAYAEYVIADPTGTVPKPANISFEAAAALVIGATTAYEGLVTRVKLEPGETVLVTAASGGVGTAAVQIAKAHGARVIGVSSAANFDLVRGLGADEVFGYSDPAWTDKVLESAPGGVDVLFDAIGHETGQESLKALRDGGRGAFIAFPNPDYEGEGRGIEGHSFSAKTSKGELTAINRLIEDGKLRAEVQTRPLDQAREALEDNQKGHTRGKVVLQT
ncbi:MAG: NADP-dependent oxidoreductase [Candidatus Dormiibacterota bacterium]